MQSEMGGWEDYIGSSFLKAENVTGPEQVFVVTNAEEAGLEEEKIVRLNLESGKDKYLFDLNKTNSIFLKNNGITHPLKLVGKRITFKKVLVNNPKTKKEVEGLRIASVIE